MHEAGTTRCEMIWRLRRTAESSQNPNWKKWTDAVRTMEINTTNVDTWGRKRKKHCEYCVFVWMWMSVYIAWLKTPFQMQIDRSNVIRAPNSIDNNTNNNKKQLFNKHAHLFCLHVCFNGQYGKRQTIERMEIARRWYLFCLCKRISIYDTRICRSSYRWLCWYFWWSQLVQMLLLTMVDMWCLWIINNLCQISWLCDRRRAVNRLVRRNWR